MARQVTGVDEFIREQIRKLAVRKVDARRGYTWEFSTSPEAHRAEYDEEELALTVSWEIFQTKNVVVPVVSEEELDEWVRRCMALESIVRKVHSEVEYEPSEREWKGRTYRQDPTIRGVDSHGQVTLTPVEEKLWRQVLGFPTLRDHYEVEV